MAAKILFSFLPQTHTHKKINNRGSVLTLPFIFLGFTFFGKSLALGDDRNFVFPFQVCQQHSRGLRRSLKLPVPPGFCGSGIRLCHLHVTWEENFSWEGIFGCRRCLGEQHWRCKVGFLIPRNYKKPKSFFVIFYFEIVEFAAASLRGEGRVSGHLWLF